MDSLVSRLFFVSGMCHMTIMFNEFPVFFALYHKLNGKNVFAVRNVNLNDMQIQLNVFLAKIAFPFFFCKLLINENSFIRQFVYFKLYTRIFIRFSKLNVSSESVRIS